MWFIGCIWFCQLPCSCVGKGQSNFSHCSPQAFKFLLPFRKGVSFLQDPTVIHWRDGNNFKLPGLYKLYWEWKLVEAPCGVCDYGSYNAHLSCWAVLVCALLAAEVFFFLVLGFFFSGLQRSPVESDVAELRVQANPQSCGIVFPS